MQTCLWVSVPGDAEKAPACFCVRQSVSLLPSRWASQLDKAQGLHLDLRCDDDDDEARASFFLSSKALTLLSAGHPTSFSSLNIGQASSYKGPAGHTSELRCHSLVRLSYLRHMFMRPNLDGVLRNQICSSIDYK